MARLGNTSRKTVTPDDYTNYENQQNIDISQALALKSNKHVYADVTAAEAATGITQDEICQVASLGMQFRYVVSGAAYIVDHTTVLATGAGGNTRWVQDSSIRALQADKVDKSQTVNGVALSGNILTYPSNYYYHDQPWAAKPVSVAADRYKLLSPNLLNLDVIGISLRKTSQATLDLSQAATWDTQTPTDYTTAANRAGKDFYVYACQPQSGVVPILLVSANASAPSGYTISNSRLIGGFHCLCVDINHTATLNAWAAATVIALGETRKATVWNGYIYRCSARASDYKTSATTEPNWASIAVGATIVDNNVTWTKIQHSLEGYLAGDILPYSVWDCIHWPEAFIPGLTYVPTIGKWVAIYSQSGTGLTTASAFGATPQWGETIYQCDASLSSVGLSHLSRKQFILAGLGSNWQSCISTATIPAGTGGHVDPYGRRLASNWGIEDMVGVLYNLVSDMSAANTALVCGGYYGAPSTSTIYRSDGLTESGVGGSTGRGCCNSATRIK